MNLYRKLYDIVFYLKDNVQPKYLLGGFLVLVVLIMMNISTILWWGLLALLFYLFYQSKKTNSEQVDESIEKICAENPKLDMCKVYNESKKNHKKVIETVKNRFGRL